MGLLRDTTDTTQEQWIYAWDALVIYTMFDAASRIVAVYFLVFHNVGSLSMHAYFCNSRLRNVWRYRHTGHCSPYDVPLRQIIPLPSFSDDLWNHCLLLWYSHSLLHVFIGFILLASYVPRIPLNVFSLVMEITFFLLTVSVLITSFLISVSLLSLFLGLLFGSLACPQFIVFACKFLTATVSIFVRSCF